MEDILTITSLFFKQKLNLQEMAIADEEEIARNEALIKILREKATYNADASRGRASKSES